MVREEQAFKDLIERRITGSTYFSWSEALWLPRWRIFAVPESDAVIANIIKTAQKMDIIRTIVNSPVTITSWYRPGAYNALIGGAKMSAHIEGLACDFVVKGMGSDYVRGNLSKQLQALEIRMESLNTPHVHIDLKCTPEMSNEQRLFKP